MGGESLYSVQVCTNFQLVTQMMARHFGCWTLKVKAFKDGELPTDTEMSHTDGISQLKKRLAVMFQGTDSGFCLNV